jgi:hypothetical protein
VAGIYDEYKHYSVDELKEKLKEHGLTKTSKMSKRLLIVLLDEAVTKAAKKSGEIPTRQRAKKVKIEQPEEEQQQQDQ